MEGSTDSLPRKTPEALRRTKIERWEDRFCSRETLPGFQFPAGKLDDRKSPPSNKGLRVSLLGLFVLEQSRTLSLDAEKSDGPFWFI